MIQQLHTCWSKRMGRRLWDLLCFNHSVAVASAVVGGRRDQCLNKNSWRRQKRVRARQARGSGLRTHTQTHTSPLSPLLWAWCSARKTQKTVFQLPYLKRQCWKSSLLHSSAVGDLVSASQATSKLMKRPESGLLSRFPYLLQHTELQFIRFITLFHHCFPLPSGL